MSKRFALIGAAGYIAPRHMKAIKETGNELVCALDPYDGVGVMDSYFPDADFFTEPERFDRHLDKLRRKGTPIDYVSICSPNYLHDAHIRMALRNGANVICEKPVVLNEKNIQGLVDLEAETGKKIYTILQLRHHPTIIELKNSIKKGAKYNINIQYITSRGKWYQYSWKGDNQKSGGVATNIGVHFFDMLTWIFGKVFFYDVFQNTATTSIGSMVLENAIVDWTLSIDPGHLPIQAKGRTYRSITINNKELEFSDGFTDLHTVSYREILSGNGFGIEDSRTGIEIVNKIRNYV
jgi:UDP-N-acetyl-2-amino-2-deoxyglucuronate dehydrogenase